MPDGVSTRTSATLVNFSLPTNNGAEPTLAMMWKKSSLVTSVATGMSVTSALANAVIDTNIVGSRGSAGRVSFSYVNQKCVFYVLHIMSIGNNPENVFRTGKSKLFPTPSVVSATFKRERRVLVQMVVLVLAFICCWLPFWIVYSVLPICANHHETLKVNT